MIANPAELRDPMSPRHALESFLRDRLFDLVPSAIAVIDRDYNVVAANATFEELFGEWRGRHCYEVYKGRKRKCLRCRAAGTFTDGKVREHAEVGLDRRGRQAHYVVHVAPVTSEDGSIPLLVEMSTDVTRQRRLGEELTRAHVLTQALVAAAEEAILAFDPRGRITHCNPAAVELFGWSRQELVGRSPPPGLVPAEVTEAMRRCDGVCHLPELEVTRRDGTKVPVSFSGAALVHGSTRLGNAAFFHDLSEVKQLEREKLDAERLAAVGQTVAGLAHGVKNILTGLEGGLYLLRSGLERGKPERLRDGLEMLTRNLGRVTAFVRALLDFSRGHTPTVALVEPVALAEETLSLYREAAAHEGVTVRVEAPAPVPPAPFDAEGISTCLDNLVTNAIDACRTSESESREVVVRVFEEPDPIRHRGPLGIAPTSVVFEVSDNGTGMDYEVKQKVFTNFFTTKGDRGTGLGLLVTRKIVNEHGGAITVDSQPGAGTTFRLAFPRRRLPRPAPDAPAT
jgi:PAS domain S-box-containing protein